MIATEEEFLVRHGARYSFGDCGAHSRGLNQRSRSGAKATLKLLADQDTQLFARRESLREIYRDKVSSGEIVPPTRRQKLEKVAGGHPDRPDVQAARRLLGMTQ